MVFYNLSGAIEGESADIPANLKSFLLGAGGCNIDINKGDEGGVGGGSFIFYDSLQLWLLLQVLPQR